MYEEFIQTLSSFLGRERMSLIQTILETFERLGNYSPWEEISLIYAGEDDLTGTQLLERVEMILEIGINDVLNQHGIVCSGTLATKIKVINFIEQVQDWSDGQGIADVIERSGGNIIGAFCDLYEYVTTESYTQIEPEIISVNAGIIDRIRQMVEETIQMRTGVIDEDYDPNLRILAIRKFASVCPDTIGVKLIRDGSISHGVSLDYLIRTYSKEIYAYEPTDPKGAAAQVLSLCVISDALPDQHIELAKRSLDQIFGDDRFHSKVILEIDNLSFGLK